MCTFRHGCVTGLGATHPLRHVHPHMPVTTRSVHPAWGLGCAQICVRVVVSLCICHVCYGALLAGQGGRGLSLCLLGAGGGTHELTTARTEWCVRV